MHSSLIHIPADTAQYIASLERRIANLEVLQQKSGMPNGYTLIALVARTHGLSTGKAEELARVAGVAHARYNGGVIVDEARFNEVAGAVISKAVRKIGSKFWYHPMLGKFTLTKGASHV